MVLFGKIVMIRPAVALGTRISDIGITYNPTSNLVSYGLSNVVGSEPAPVITISTNTITIAVNTGITAYRVADTVGSISYTVTC